MVFWGAILFAVAAMAVVGLHVSLILGAPWGFMTMGGRHPGVLPRDARVASAVQAVLVLALTWGVLRAAGVIGDPRPGSWVPWLAVAVSAVSSVLNTITPSRRERYFGIPATLSLLAGSLAVALGG